MIIYGDGGSYSGKLENVTRIKSIAELEQARDVLAEKNSQDVRPAEIVILFKQTSLEEEEFLTEQGYTVFAVEGIRFPCRKFSSIDDFVVLVDEAERIQRMVRRDEYLRHFSSFTEEEEAYLVSHYGVSQSLLYRETVERLSFGYSGRLLTYRGADQGLGNVVKMFAKSLKKTRFAVVDGDLLRPSLDSVFGLAKVTTAEKSYLTGKDNTGFNIALDMLAKEESIDAIVRKTMKRYRKNIYFLLGNYNIYNYEHYDMDLIQTLISGLLQRFDVVLIRLSDSPYDELAMFATHRADYNMVLLGTSRSSVRYWHQFYDMLIYKQDISASKIAVYRQKILSQSSYLLKALFHESYRGVFALSVVKHLKRVVL